MARKKMTPVEEPEKIQGEQIFTEAVSSTVEQAVAAEQPEVLMSVGPEQEAPPDDAAETTEENGGAEAAVNEDVSPASDDHGQVPASGSRQEEDPHRNGFWPPADEPAWAETAREAGGDNSLDAEASDAGMSRIPEEGPILPAEQEVLSVDLSAPAEAPPPATENAAFALEDESLGDAGTDTSQKEAEEPIVLPEELVLEEAVPEKSDRQKFFELKFNRLDRTLTTEERQEWNSIYASYRGRSALTGTIIGIDPYHVDVWNREVERMERQTMYCAIVIPYRVRIVIPSTEMWDRGWERPDFVLQNMVGATIDFIITKVDRESGFAIASRRLAMRARRYYFSRRPALNAEGARLKCRVMAVGPRRCLVECYGHDLNLTQRELRYTAIPDLRNEYHPGQELDCVIKSYDPAADKLEISVKETESNPYDGAELRHPVGSRRQGVIAGKYGGGVFCNLPDGTVCMCSYAYQHEDADFMIGDTVILVVQRFDEGKKQMYGKILSKW